MYTFEDLKQIMKTLRAEDGCPWDRAQDHDTLKKHLVEECAEVLEAIDNHDTENLCEELGDVLFQVMFHSEIEAERGNFTVDDVVNGICEKMIRRHPRIFGGEIPEVEDEKDLIGIITAVHNKGGLSEKSRCLFDRIKCDGIYRFIVLLNR